MVTTTTEDCTALGGCDWSRPSGQRCRDGHVHAVRVCRRCLVDTADSCREAELAAAAAGDSTAAADGPSGDAHQVTAAAATAGHAGGGAAA